MNLVGVMMLYLMLWQYLAFSSGSASKQSTYNAGNTGEVGLIPGMGRYSEGECSPVFWPGKSHGQKNLVGYSPMGCSVGHDLVTECGWIYGGGI